MSLIRIGYWRADHAPEWPDVADFVDHSWDEDERWTVRAYLTGGTAVRHYMGFSACRICGKKNGTSEFTDGTFIWPEGLAHYVGEHGVRLPARFVDHATAAIERLEAEPVDTSWWLSLATWRQSGDPGF